MIRLFEQHEVRRQIELEGLWDFSISSDGQIPKLFESTIYVPGCWENNIQYNNYRGYGIYRKKIRIKEIGHYVLTFKGVSHTAEIYIDRVKIGEHYNAFTEFTVEFDAAVDGDYELVVVVNNIFSESSTLHIPNDYYTYGGIIRPVYLEKIGQQYIEYVHFTPKYSEEKWSSKVELLIHENFNLSEYKMFDFNCRYKQSYQLNYYLDELEIHPLSEKSTLIDNQVQLNLEFDFSEFTIDPWSPNNPRLYLLKIQIVQTDNRTIIDDYIDRVGFRVISVNKGKIELNYKPITLVGFNRHEDYNIFGCSQPVQGMAIDLALMKDMGCNTVRTSHYPNDERFLDLCDELGFVIWEENHARGLSLEQMKLPKFEEQCSLCNEEMIMNHFNHPSIIIWGILNECASHTPEGREMYKKQFEQIRCLDTSRLLTFATCQHYKDLCFDLVDIISVNVYFGWYDQCKTKEQIENEWDKELAWIREKGGSNKPIIISEFGAGAIYGYRSPYNPKWSEERQAEVLKQTLEIYLNRPEINGTYIWQFCDVRVTEEEWAMVRPRCMNNKGIVDEYRRPKLSYAVVKENYIKRSKHNDQS